jgi:hypothetical protein
MVVLGNQIYMSRDDSVNNPLVSFFEFVGAYITVTVNLVRSKNIPIPGVLFQSANRSILSLPTLLNTSFVKLIKYKF